MFWNRRKSVYQGLSDYFPIEQSNPYFEKKLMWEFTDFMSSLISIQTPLHKIRVGWFQWDLVALHSDDRTVFSKNILCLLWWWKLRWNYIAILPNHDGPPQPTLNLEIFSEIKYLRAWNWTLGCQPINAMFPLGNFRIAARQAYPGKTCVQLCLKLIVVNFWRAALACCLRVNDHWLSPAVLSHVCGHSSALDFEKVPSAR